MQRYLWIGNNLWAQGEDRAAHPEGGVPLKVVQGAGMNGVGVVIPIQN